MVRLCLLLLGIALAHVSVSGQHHNRQAIEPGHPRAVNAAKFAVRELQKLSDTGIYETLVLKKIVQASTGVGVFHYNSFLTIELASSYFKSGHPSETFDMMVMRHKESGHVSFAINTFPEMDPEALEDFYIEKVERQRQARVAFFNKLDAEVEGGIGVLRQEGNSDPAALATSMMRKRATELAKLIDEGGDLGQAAQDELDRRWESSVEGQLSLLNTTSLKDILSDLAAPPFKQSIAKEILASRLRFLGHQE